MATPQTHTKTNCRDQDWPIVWPYPVTLHTPLVRRGRYTVSLIGCKLSISLYAKYDLDSS